jgi:hypothetical protein
VLLSVVSRALLASACAEHPKERRALIVFSAFGLMQRRKMRVETMFGKVMRRHFVRLADTNSKEPPLREPQRPGQGAARPRTSRELRRRGVSA